MRYILFRCPLEIYLEGATAVPGLTTPAHAETRPRSARTGAARLARTAGDTFRTGPLAHRSFRLLTAGQTTSAIGDFCYAVALPWMVLSAHGGVALLGLILACYGIPRTALIPVGGILVDRFSGRVVMLTADAIRCGLVCALLVLDAHHVTSLAALGPVAALVGACSGLFIPASFSILPQLLPAEQLQAGNAISSAGNQLGGFVGPALAGALVTAFGTVTAFGIDAATFAVSALTLLLMGRNGTPAADPEPRTAGVPARKKGFGALLREPVLQNLMVVALVANLVLIGTFEIAMPDLAHEHFGAAGYGAMLACFGVGALAGALAAARRRPPPPETPAAGTGRRQRPPSVTACGAFVVAAACIAVVPYLGGLPGACAAILLLAVFVTFGDIIVITLVQQWAPPALLGRVMSMLMLASNGAFPLSVALSGLLVRDFGPQPFFPASGIVLAAAAVAAMSRREIRRLGVS
jgi:MFS family permease